MVQRWNGSTPRNCSDPAPLMLGLPSLSMGDGARPRPAPLSPRPSANEKLACNRRLSQARDSASQPPSRTHEQRKIVVSGKSVSVRVEHGGRRFTKKHKTTK